MSEHQRHLQGKVKSSVNADFRLPSGYLRTHRDCKKMERMWIQAADPGCAFIAHYKMLSWACRGFFTAEKWQLTISSPPFHGKVQAPAPTGVLAPKWPSSNGWLLMLRTSWTWNLYRWGMGMNCLSFIEPNVIYCLCEYSLSESHYRDPKKGSYLRDHGFLFALIWKGYNLICPERHILFYFRHSHSLSWFMLILFLPRPLGVSMQ